VNCRSDAIRASFAWFALYALLHPQKGVSIGGIFEERGKMSLGY
jgi:hypothetical protein